jgi:hypothetical protein
MAEQRKAASDSKLWNLESERAKLIFFGIELSGCLGPEAQHICKQMAGVGGEGPEGLKKIYESLSFQVNRAIRIELRLHGGRICCSSADETKVDMTSIETSGISKHAKLHQWREWLSKRKAVGYSKLWPSSSVQRRQNNWGRVVN